MRRDWYLTVCCAVSVTFESPQDTFCRDQVWLAQTYSQYVKCADPAAEDFAYPVSFDVRDLISLQDAMDELKLGPNG